MAGKGFFRRIGEFLRIVKPAPKKRVRKVAPPKPAPTILPPTPVVPTAPEVTRKIARTFPDSAFRPRVAENVGEMSDAEKRAAFVAGPEELQRLARRPADRMIAGEWRNPYWYH